MAVLRAAGLSQRKAEYVQDLALRFADGRLTAKGLMAMSDEEVMDALVQVRGIGRWTVEMFMIFTLRRPNVLPCGDLGVQKGLVRWFTVVNPSIHSKKKDGKPNDTTSAPSATSVPSTPSKQQGNEEDDAFTTPGPPIPVTPKKSNGEVDVPLMTPTTERTAQLPPFPSSKTLTPDSLRARSTKKIKWVALC